MKRIEEIKQKIDEGLTSAGLRFSSNDVTSTGELVEFWKDQNGKVY